MKHIDELKSKALSLKSRKDQLMAAGGDHSEREYAELCEVTAELKAIKSKMDTYKDVEGIDSWMNDASNPFSHSATKSDEAIVTSKGDQIETQLKGLSLNQLNAIRSSDYTKAFGEYLKVGTIHRMNAGSYKAIQEGADGSGGFLVPEQIQVDLVQKKQGMTSISDRCRRLTTGRDTLVVPRNNYTTDNVFASPVRLAQTGEIPVAAANVTDPTFGQSKIDIYTFMAVENVTKDMLEDSLFDMSGFISEQFAIAQRQQTENYIINGTGVDQPVGLLANPGGVIGNQAQPGVVPLIVGTNSNNLITTQGLVNLAYSVEPQYEDNLHWVFNKTNTARGMYGMVDTQGRLMFGTGYQESGLKYGASDKRELLGYGYSYSNQMPNGYTTNGASGNLNAYPIIFGDFKGAYLVERAALSIQVLDQTLATLNQIQLVGRYRFGFSLVEDWKLKIGKIASS